MPDIDTLVGKWAQERLFHGPLAMDAPAANQVWDAVTELRKNFSPKNAADAVAAVEKMVADKFMNAPPLTHNTPAVNQLNAAVTDLKARFERVFKEASSVTLSPPPPPPPKAKETATEPKE